MQYPHLHPVDGRPLPEVPEHLIPELVSVCTEVKSRTGCTGFYHQGLRSIQWHVGDTPSGGPAADVLFQRDRYIPVDVNRTVEAIQRATNKTRAQKDAEMRDARSRSIERQYRDQASRASDLAPEFKSRLEYTLRKGENKHSQRVFTIP